MADALVKIGGSRIQHGPNSDRVYLMKLDPADMPELRDRVEEIAREHGYGKIFAKVPAGQGAAFLEHGYRREARVPGYYRGTEDAWFLGRYLKEGRDRDPRADRVAEVLAVARAKTPLPRPELPPRLTARELTPGDAEGLARLYRAVFASYPFPIHEEAYLRETMRTHVAYFGIFDGARLMAAASSEIDADALAVEMTDFATLPAYRRRGLARYLLAIMRDAMIERGIRTAITIARAVSFGMNITFARCGYTFGGTLVNNTDISGGIESMNVWYR